MPTCSRTTPSVTKTILQEVLLSHFVHLEEDLHLFGFNFVPPKPEVARFFMSHFGLDLKDVNSLLWSKQGPKGNHGDFVSIREPSCIAETLGTLPVQGELCIFGVSAGEGWQKQISKERQVLI